MIIPNADILSHIRSFPKDAMPEFHFSSLFLTKTEGTPGKKGFTKEPRKDAAFEQFIYRATLAFDTKEQFTSLVKEILATFLFTRETHNFHVCLHTLKTAVLDPARLPTNPWKNPRLSFTMRNEDTPFISNRLRDRWKSGWPKPTSSHFILDEGWEDIRVSIRGSTEDTIAKAIAEFFSFNERAADDHMVLISAGTH
ncbi:MAG: hypothetical protein Q7R79_00220 [bacterium]|nr:hypothetical protein [bacterium]